VCERERAREKTATHGKPSCSNSAGYTSLKWLFCRAPPIPIQIVVAGDVRECVVMAGLACVHRLANRVFPQTLFPQ